MTEKQSAAGSPEYIIRETDDFLALSTFFQKNGLGVDIEERKPERIIKMWRMEDAQTGLLMAAVTLEERGGVYALGDIAVNGDTRGHGYGAVMQQLVFRQARNMGIRTLWACAKEPKYYLHHGWQIVDWDDAPDIAVYCSTCAKRGKECIPQKMRYTLDD